MSECNDGGLAFPAAGMTVRDYFAAKALTVIAPTFMPCQCRDTFNFIAEECYAMADAMLETRDVVARSEMFEGVL